MDDEKRRDIFAARHVVYGRQFLERGVVAELAAVRIEIRLRLQRVCRFGARDVALDARLGGERRNRSEEDE
ncbi:MAG TPA: hypothetical protein VM029_03885 [Opitutaceae bacterium]|nr:hypothetical protein [Opitutaceae bacterium]